MLSLRRWDQPERHNVVGCAHALQPYEFEGCVYSRSLEAACHLAKPQFHAAAHCVRASCCTVALDVE
jgi:hypothetical protein